ncbi:monooxygenase [Recurvomyces mirabilis]|uniref:Monooxygenase n=1 Tax=Recurvomyces mirabilis TaxID=574656 RepID=A0AAE0TNF1_9PEZI|nr:monooxygenase [Recurvomyces mirabilis]KAK5149927.1 monooxygenase [Recurvomyces mirabilis]
MGSLPPERRFKVSSVCIIGAGPSGLVAAKYLRAEKAFSRIQIYEQRATVGGIWNYVPHSSPTAYDSAIPQTNPFAEADRPIWKHSNASKILGEDKQEKAAFLTPLYDRLETNIPRGLMGFSDLDWPGDSQLFPKHETVMEYIEQYAEDVRDTISWRTQVLDVQLTEDKRWTVKTQEVSHGKPAEVREETYDAVIVANGHFNIPYIPEVKGLEKWSKAYPGCITHSKFYRKPEHFTGQKIIVVGNSASGVDIGAQIQTTCKPPIIVSSKSESFLLDAESTKKLDKPPIAEFVVKDRSVRFEDGSRESEIDAVLYCTGYFYSFPFLQSLEPPLITTGEKVEHLYQHIFYQPHPTLAFPVLNQKVIPFPLAEAQCAIIARVFSGRLSLPTEHEMRQWELEWAKSNGDGRMFHVLKFPKDADYINMLHAWARGADAHDRAKQSSGHESDGVSEGGAVGKTPPFWSGREYWTRERFPAMKKAFQDLGERRHNVRSLAELGFDYEDWQAKQG